MNHTNGHPTRDGATEVPDRMPPYSLEAERCALGCFLLDNRTLDDVSPPLREDDFYRDSHQVLYRHIAAIHAAGDPFDGMILADHLDAADELKAAGGDEGITACLKAVPHAANAAMYASIVRGKALLRRGIEALTESLAEMYRAESSSEDLVGRAEGRLFAIRQDRANARTISFAQSLDATLDRIDARRNGEKIQGVATGLIDLDDLLGGGMQNQEVVILAARPSMGKTAACAQFAASAAFDQGIPVLIFSLEMSHFELCERLISSRGLIRAEAIKDPRFVDQSVMTRISVVAGKIRSGPIYVNDNPVMSMAAISAEARRQRASAGIGLVVIDYIQLIEPEASNRRNATRQEQVAQISRSLKIMAKQLGIPVLALSQLNRESEARADKRPIASDLRESGALEQDADVILLLHRPECYDPNDAPGMAELSVRKNRNGRQGLVTVKFRGEFMRFENLSQGEPAGDHI